MARMYNYDDNNNNSNNNIKTYQGLVTACIGLGLRADPFGHTPLPSHWRCVGQLLCHSLFPHEILWIHRFHWEWPNVATVWKSMSLLHTCFRCCTIIAVFAYLSLASIQASCMHFFLQTIRNGMPPANAYTLHTAHAFSLLHALWWVGDFDFQFWRPQIMSCAFCTYQLFLPCNFDVHLNVGFSIGFAYCKGRQAMLLAILRQQYCKSRFFLQSQIDVQWSVNCLPNLISWLHICCLGVQPANLSTKYTSCSLRWSACTKLGKQGHSTWHIFGFFGVTLCRPAAVLYN